MSERTGGLAPRWFVALAALPALLLAACSGEEAGEDEPTPAEVLASAKQNLDETSGVRIELATDELPDGVSGLAGAEGVGTHAPAFDGSITVVLSGTSFDVPVVAVDGVVYARLPLTVGWTEDIDPGEYGAPDPATLLSTEGGFSSLLTATADPRRGESVRGGEDNDEILIELTGTVPGDAVGAIIPTAEGEFDATYTVTDDDQLREMALTGVFYPDTDPITYTVTFDEYGSEPDIVAP
jgi:lipoprotein LprG